MTVRHFTDLAAVPASELRAMLNDAVSRKARLEAGERTKPFEGNRLSSDPVRYARNAALSAAARELAIGDPSVGWVHAAFQLMDRLAQPRAPLLRR